MYWHKIVVHISLLELLTLQRSYKKKYLISFFDIQYRNMVFMTINIDCMQSFMVNIFYDKVIYIEINKRNVQINYLFFMM